MPFIVVIAVPDAACSCRRSAFFFCVCVWTSRLFVFVVFLGATVVIVVAAAVAVVVAVPLLFFIHVDPASWLLILWPCVNR